MVTRKRLLLATLLSIAALTLGNLLGFSPIASAQSSPGEFIELPTERVPNPVHGSSFAVASSCRSVTQPCAWDSPSTWTAGQVPGTGTRVIIDGNVQIADDSAVARSIGVYPDGLLSFATNADTQLRTADLVVFQGGTLEIGTNAAPIATGSRAEVVFRDVAFDSSDQEQHLRGLLSLSGTVSIAGHEISESFIRTSSEPQAGTSTISLQQSASTAGWQVGDVIVIPTSRQCPVASETCTSQTEDRTITAISSDGQTLTLDQPLTFDHPGARSVTGSLDYTPHVINTSRNVILRSENPNGIRGHMLFNGRSDVDMRYAEVRSFGRTNIEDLGSNNQKGRYPVHAHHLFGPTSPQANGYQFTFVGNSIDFGSENVQQNRKWGLAIHGSHYGLIDNNVVDNASGAAIVTESGSEAGNLFRENFAVRVVGGNGARTEDTDPGDGTKLGRAGVGYWFNGGGRNFIEQNVAADVAECIYCYGFKFDNVRNGELTFPTKQGSIPHMDGGETVLAETVGLNNVVGNETYAVPNGLTVWWECSFGDFPVEGCTSRVDDFQVWHHHRWGILGYPVSNMTLSNFVVRGDPTVLTNKYSNVTGLEFSDYMHRNLRIIGADIQNVHEGIALSSMRHERGATGPDVGFNWVEDSYIAATEGINVYAPASVNNPVSALSPQTSLIRNVKFDFPSVDLGNQERIHIKVNEFTKFISDDMRNTDVRNDVWVYNYDSLPGQDGPDLYVVPNYHGPQRCDGSIGNCGSEVTGSYPLISDGLVYPLLASAAEPEVDFAPETTRRAPASQPAPAAPEPEPTPAPPTTGQQPAPVPSPGPATSAPTAGSDESKLGNGTFDARTAPWYSWSSDNSARLSLSGGTARLTHDANPGHIAQVFQETGALRAGQTYRLRFDVRADPNNAEVSAFFQQSSGSFRLLSQIETFRVSSQTETVEVLITATEDQDTSTLIIQLDGSTQAIWIDNVSLVNVTAPSKVSDVSRVSNGGFDSQTSPWYSWSSDGSSQLTVEAGKAKLTHAANSGQVAQLFQRAGALQEGRTYRLQLDISADRNDVPVSAYFQEFGGAFRSLSQVETELVSAQTGTVEYLLTATQDQPTSTIIIELDDTAQAVYADNISLVELAASDQRSLSAPSAGL